MPAKKGDRNRQIHGGAAAEKAISKGEPLTGLARRAELAVYDELGESGRYALVVRNASRLQAAADLYWDAVSKAAQDRDLDALDRYIKRFGWLSGASLRAWAQVRQEQTTSDEGTRIVDAIAAAKDAGKDTDEMEDKDEQTETD